MRNRRWWQGLAIVLVGVSGLGACGGGTKKSAPTSAQASATTISIKDFAFHPESLKVPAGTTITVRNDDTTDHTATADDKSFDTGHVGGGATATFKVPAAGKITYHCDIHDYMRGSIEAS